MQMVQKQVGETMGQLVERFRIEQNIPRETSVTYAGRLDPAAAGLVIMLTGDEVHDKGRYLQLDKTYEFSVLFGVATDTYDLLGLPTRVVPLDAVPDINPGDLVGNWQQPYPAYSSRTVAGKPLWQWAREGGLDQIQIPTKDVVIYALEIQGQEVITGKKLLDQVEDVATRVNGDFRQYEIVTEWHKQVSVDSRFVQTDCTVRVSSGAYIRCLAVRMGQSLGMPALAMGIVRTTIGEYTR